MFTPLWSGGDQPALADCAEEQAWNEARLAQPVLHPVLRLWTYRAPGVVLGCAQRRLLGPAGGVDGSAPGEVARLPADGSGIPVIARLAGGGAVLAGPWMLSVSVLLPHGHRLLSSGLVDSYRWLGEVFAGVLRGRGIACHAITPAEAVRLRERRAGVGDGGDALDWACYGGYSPWEVVAGGRKLVGLAQVRRRTGVLLAAGLLLAQPDWRLLTAAMGRPGSEARALAVRNTSCAQLLGPGDWAGAIAGPLRRALEFALYDMPEAAELQEMVLY